MEEKPLGGRLDPLVTEGLTLYELKEGGEGVFHKAQGFWAITLEVIRVNSRNLVTFPKI